MSEATSPIRVILVNDYEIVVKGLERMLEPFRDRIEVVELQAGGLPEASADIALFDTFAGRRHSLGRVRAMAADVDIQRVVLYTWDVPDEFANDIRTESIDGVILKSTTGKSLVSSIEKIHRGEPVGDELSDGHISDPVLTEREREVLALIAQGFSNRQIADELYLSLDTIKTHVRKLFKKLDVNNRTQAAMLAIDYQLALNV